MRGTICRPFSASPPIFAAEVCPLNQTTLLPQAAWNLSWKGRSCNLVPKFSEQKRYAGGVGHRDESFVEYDMDEADWRWLNKFNQGQDRLPPRRFELLIWRLELVNADANDQQSLMTGWP